MGRRVAVHPVHLFLPESAAQSREILIYVDSAMARPEGQARGAFAGCRNAAFVAALESRFQENAFQLRPADLEYFLADLEEVLRTGLQEDWASRPDWKQDAEGFVLSRLVTEWVKQTNYLNPGRLVTLRKSLDDYRRLQRQCALRELEVEDGGFSAALGMAADHRLVRDAAGPADCSLWIAESFGDRVGALPGRIVQEGQ